MKKIAALVLVIVLALTLTACDGISLVSDLIEKNNVSTRTYDLSPGIEEGGERFSHSYDMDGDGIDEAITMEIVYASYDDLGTLQIHVGDYTKYTDIFYGVIDKVYVCDMDTTDGVWDLAVITMEESGDPRIRIFKYGESLMAYNFMLEYIDEKSIEDSNWIGYVSDYYFNVNDDDTLTIKEQTPSMGMWLVYKKYARGSQGIYEEIRPEKYDILPKKIEYYDGWDDTFINKEKEIEMLEKGYYMAHCSYSDGEISLITGEFFKPLYDDGNNHIYIEKENGEGGWLDVSYENFGDIRYELNPMFFMLAG